MLNVKVYDMEGKEAGSIELNEKIFGIPVNVPVLHAAIKNYLANQRQGTQSTMCIRDRSPRGEFSSTSSSEFFSDGTDSPVKADSALLRLTLCRSLASAGIKSPASRRIMSPGTS